MATTLFDQWKEGIDEVAPYSSLTYFEEAFLGHLFPLDSKEAKV